MTTTEEGLNIIKKYANELLCKVDSSGLYIKPNIPPKKLKNALEKYGGNIQKDEVIALLDSTVFGSAREGAIITAYNIVCNPAFFPIVTIWYDEIYSKKIVKHPEYRHLDRVLFKLRNGEEILTPEMIFNPEGLEAFVGDMMNFSCKKNNFLSDSGNKFDDNLYNNKQVNLEYE